MSAYTEYKLLYGESGGNWRAAEASLEHTADVTLSCGGNVVKKSNTFQVISYNPLKPQETTGSPPLQASRRFRVNCIIR